MVKYRNAGSYYGNTTEARKKQRANLIPGNIWQKRKIQELRLNCWWENASIFDMQFIYEGYENKRDINDVPKSELKSESCLNNWWGKLGLEDKKHIYKNIMAELTKESRSSILKDVEEKLARAKLEQS